MKIMSLNVNNFGGKYAKPLLCDFKKVDGKVDWNEWNNAVDNWRDKYNDIIISNVKGIADVILDYDVVFLHEVDTNCVSWEFLKSKLNNDFKFEMPNGTKIEEYNKGRKSVSCALINKELNYICSDKNSFDSLRNVELQFGDMQVVGLHMNYETDMWNSLEKLAKELAGKTALIIGDLNVYDEGTERKNKLNSLVGSGEWADIWIQQGEENNTPTCNTEKRIDYALATKSLADGGVHEIIINAIRRQNLSDHAAIIAIL